MSTTTTYTPTGGVTILVNGTDVTTLPVDMVQHSAGTEVVSSGTDIGAFGEAIPSGTILSTVASYYAAGAAGLSHLPRLQENFGGGTGYGNYSGFAPAPSPAQTVSDASAIDAGGSTTQGAFQAAIRFAGSVTEARSAGFTYYQPPATLPLGDHTLDVTPCAGAMVCRNTGMIGSSEAFEGIDGVKVTVTVNRTGGDYTLLDEALTTTTQREPKAVIGRTYHYTEGAGFIQLSSAPWTSGTAAPTSGQPHKACAAPLSAYDPYFGRTPTAVKDVTGITLRLEFPSGKVWTTALSNATLYAASGSGASSGTQGDGQGPLNITDPAAAGIKVSLQSAFSKGVFKYGQFNNGGPPDTPSPDDTGMVTARAAYADPSDVSYAGSDGFAPGSGIRANFGEVTPQTTDVAGVAPSGSPDIGERGSILFAINGPMFVFVLDTGYDTSAGPAVASLGLHEDGHRRTVAVSPGSSLAFLSTKDGGSTFGSYSAGGSGPKNASVFVDPRTNTPRILWDDGTTLSVTKATKDGEQGDWV